MATFTRSDDLQGAELARVDLRGARASFLRINGVDVIPFVDSDLNRRFPGLRFAP